MGDASDGGGRLLHNFVNVVAFQGHAHQANVQFGQIMIAENDSRDFLNNTVKHGVGFLVS